MTALRHVVGIDLGTTHSVMASSDPGEAAPQVRIEPIPQVCAAGSVEARAQLPSFLYVPHPDEFPASDLTLPWASTTTDIVGQFARQSGVKTPIRLVSSAKSWLCHGGVDRRQAFLPAHSPEDVPKCSPLEASAAYLTHLRQAWDHAHPDAPLAEQSVVLTVPASFDPSARDLTVEAARLAGLANVTLLEEPQAAVYSWVARAGDDWRHQVSVGDVILVIDVGGGTTDLSLVAVNEHEGSLALERIAVGEHILLGGDNMDLALAFRLKQRLEAEGRSLQGWQVTGLAQGCREAKELLLSDDTVESVPIVVPSRGAKLMGGSLRTELTRADVLEALVDGFFPVVGIDDHPRQASRAALTQLGLPYASDAAITRHVAAFLSRQAGVDGREGFVRPTRLLFNGGVFKAQALAARMMEVINGWLRGVGAADITVLEGADLDLAVARGAAYYGHVRRGRGVRIRGGLASSFYVGIESAMPAIPGMEPPLEAFCVAPFGMEEGTEGAVPPREFGLVVGQPVHFRFFRSTTRRDDVPGVVLADWDPEELTPLPDIQALLPAEGDRPGRVVPVRLGARVSDVGTLQLEAVSLADERRWTIEFNVRER